MSIPPTMSADYPWELSIFLNTLDTSSLDRYVTQSTVNPHPSTVSRPITANHTVQWPSQVSDVNISSISQLALNLLSSSSSRVGFQNELSHPAPPATSFSSRKKRQLPPDSANNSSDTDELPLKRRRENSSSSSSTDGEASTSSQVSISSVNESFQIVIVDINTLIDSWITVMNQCNQSSTSKDQLTLIASSLPLALTMIQKKRAEMGSTSSDTDWDKKLTNLRNFHTAVADVLKQHPDTQEFYFSNTPNSSASSDTQASSSSSIPTSQAKVSKGTKIEELEVSIKNCFTIIDTCKGKKGVKREILEDVKNRLNSISMKNYVKMGQLNINTDSLNAFLYISNDLNKIFTFYQMLENMLIKNPNIQFFSISEEDIFS